jgi:hypothetical protein
MIVVKNNYRNFKLYQPKIYKMKKNKPILSTQAINKLLI